MSSLFPPKPGVEQKKPVTVPTPTTTQTASVAPPKNKEIGPFLGVVEHGTVGYVVYAIYTEDGRILRMENLNTKDGDGQQKPISKTAALDIFRTHSVKNFWGRK